MAETMNRKVQLAAARVDVLARLNDADVLKHCRAGCEEFNVALRPIFRQPLSEAIA